MTNRVVADADENDLREALVGKKIVEVQEKNSKLVLDDGTVLEFEDVYDCCAWFEAELRAGNLTDNAVTSVELVENNEDEDSSEENYTLHILAADRNIASVDVTGSVGMGNYCWSFNLRVHTPDLV